MLKISQYLTNLSLKRKGLVFVGPRCISLSSSSSSSSAAAAAAAVTTSSCRLYNRISVFLPLRKQHTHCCN